jgi:hypothetical protein
LVTQAAAGYNGFSRELVGFHGQWRIFTAFLGAPANLFFPCSRVLCCG